MLVAWISWAFMVFLPCWVDDGRTLPAAAGSHLRRIP
jgi:hypothetical protein